MNKTFKIRFAGIPDNACTLAVFGTGVMLLWNALFPGIFGLPALNYRQAAGLLLLSRILFGRLGGFGGRLFMLHGWYGRYEQLFHHGNTLWEKLMSMTDEERKIFFEKEKDFLRFHRGFSCFHDFFDGNGEKPNEKDASAKKEENNE
jgi:hypothetical protein